MMATRTSSSTFQSNAKGSAKKRTASAPGAASTAAKPKPKVSSNPNPRVKARSKALVKRKARWNPQEVLRTRMRLVLVCFLIFLGFIVQRLALISFDEEIAREAEDLWTYDGPILAARGDILDRYGTLLATSLDSDTIVAAPPLFEEQDISVIAERLAPILDMEKAEIYDRLSSPMQQIYLKRLVEPEITAQVEALIKELKIEGLNVFKEPKRYYPWNNFASTVLGITGSENKGLEGIEEYYEKQLSGENGRLTRQNTVSGMAIPDTPSNREPPKDGNHLVLTLDQKIQSSIERIVESTCKANESESASAIVMDPHTGEILAMASYPNFDPNHYDDYPDTLRRNKLISEAFEPGSTFKLITAFAALEEGLVSEDDYFEDPGYIYVGGTWFENWAGSSVNHGWETFRDAMRNSCNVVLAQVGELLGAERLCNYHRLMGFGELTCIDYWGESSGILFEASEMGPAELATAAFGQGPAVTPIQQVTAIAAIANGGKLMQPHLALELRNSAGQSVEKVEPVVVREVGSSQTMQRMRLLMEYIINAPGSKGASEEYRLAGKTGTANKYNPDTGRYYDDKYIASTIGFAPADKPLYVIYVYVDDPKGPNGYYGGQVAAPAFRAIAEDLLSRDSRAMQISTGNVSLPAEIYASVVPSLVGSDKVSAAEELQLKRIQVQLIGEGEYVLAQYPEATSKAEITPGQTVTLYLGNPQLQEEGFIVVPDFSHKTMKEVLSVTSQLKLTHQAVGQGGAAYEQQPAAGAVVSKGTVLKVSYR